MMDDRELIAHWRKITDVRAALDEVVKNQHVFGYDPYYGDLHQALLEMAARVADEAPVCCQGLAPKAECRCEQDQITPRVSSEQSRGGE